MRTVELIPGVKSSVLGFGCAPVLGAIDARKAQRAIECALDNGINHFDLARSYGYGEAERFVGKVVKTKRKDLVIATKFGIQPSWIAKALIPAKPFVRMLKGEPTKHTAPDEKVSDMFLRRVPITGILMRNSLEKSLMELGTDYIDYLFIHEPADSLHNLHELEETARRLKQEGKIRAWGIAYMRDQENLHQRYLDSFDVLQFNNSPGSVGYEEVVLKRSLKPNILFSPLRSGDPTLSASEKLSTLFNDFPNSVVICSMFNEQHLKNNVQLLTELTV